MRPRTSHLALGIIVFCAALSPALAQEAPSVSPKIAAFEKMLGHWQGTGTVHMPGMPEPMPWTSVTTVRPVLGGHFIASDMKLEFGGALPPMVYRAYYGYDANRDELVSYSIGNTGEVDISDRTVWTDDNTLLQVSMVDEEGMPQIHRSETKFAGDEQTFYWEMAAGADDFVKIVEGKNTRIEKGFEIDAAAWQAPFMPMPVPEPMQKIGRMAGQYRMSGEMTMVPGGPKMEISASESIDAIFGGGALRMHVKGDPIPGMDQLPNYEAMAFIGWHPGKECFLEFWISNMGETSVHELRFVGDSKLVSTSAQMMDGKPEAHRGTVVLDESGAVKQAIMHRMSADHEPERAFTGTYERVTEGSKSP